MKQRGLLFRAAFFWGEDKAENPNNYLYTEGYRKVKVE